MGELRDFIYIDDESLNNHLSSLGRGVPAEVIESGEDETEKGGEAGGTIMGIGAKGRYSKFGRNAVETTLQITAPYRFQDLLEALEDEEINIYENPDPRSLARGDVVRISGTTKPMSLFKFEVTIRTMREIINTQIQEALEELEGGAIETEEGFDISGMGTV